MRLSVATKIKVLLEKNPPAKAVDIAKTLGVSVAYVYAIKKKIKDKVPMSVRKAGRPVKAKELVEEVIFNSPLVQAFPTTRGLWQQIGGFFTSNTSIKDMVNSPAHYKTGGIETIDFIRAKELGFNLGNAVKYISRAGKKNPALFKQDIEKAIWYLNEELRSR